MRRTTLVSLLGTLLMLQLAVGASHGHSESAELRLDTGVECAWCLSFSAALETTPPVALLMSPHPALLIYSAAPGRPCDELIARAPSRGPPGRVLDS